MIAENFESQFARVQRAIADGPITPTVTPDEIRAHLQSRFDFAQPMALEDAILAVEEMMSKWQVQITHPRYFGLFNPSVTFASTVADSLVAMYNPQLASWRTSPAANEIEKFTLDWVARKFGLPGETLGNFTSGGAEANLSAVIVALTRSFPGYGDLGARSLHAAPAIYLTTEAHHSFAKIAHMTGIGRCGLRKVATDQSLRMNLEDLARQIEEDRANGFAPFMVVGTAGTTAAGAIDPLPELGDFCKTHDLWFHVDAAWGGAAILAPSLRNCLHGIEHADSVTCDAHKWFSVPMGCGMFLCRHPENVLEAFRAEAAYMPGKANGAAFDPYTSTVQWSRRFIGLKLFLSLVTQGESGYAAMIEHQARMGRFLRQLLSESGWCIVNETPLPLICFTRDGIDIPRFLGSLYDRQIAWMSEARIGGDPVIRACITSFRTTEQDVRQVVEGINQVIEVDSEVLSAPTESR